MEGMMTSGRKQLIFTVLTGVLFLLAGLRDIFFPGFLSISSRPSDGTGSLTAGLVFLALAARRWSHSARSQA
jgi:hypothetical protein